MAVDNDWVDNDIWSQLLKLAEVTGESPRKIAMEILREGVKVRAEAERLHLEAEFTALQARMATLGGAEGLSKASVRPAEMGNARKAHIAALSLAQTVRNVLASDRRRTWTVGEVIEQMEGLGYDTEDVRLNQRVGYALWNMFTHGEVSKPARGQYTLRRQNRA